MRKIMNDLGLVLCLFFYSANSCVSAQTLLPGAEVLFKGVKTKIADADKNDIFLKKGFYYNAADKKLTPGKGVSSKDFFYAVLPTDMNKDGIEEIFIQERLTSSQKPLQRYGIFISKNGKYQNAGKIEIPSAAYYLFVYKSTSLGYNDLGYNTPAKIYRYNGSEFKESNLAPGDYINAISDYSLDYTSPLLTITNLSTVTDYVFRNIKTRLANEEKKIFTGDLIIQYRENSDTSLKYVFDKTEITNDLPRADIEIFPTDLNNDGVEEIFIRLNSSYFGQWLAPLEMYIKGKANMYQRQDSVGGITSPRLFARTTGYGGYPDLDYRLWRLS